MAYLKLIVALALIGATLADDSCPDANQIKPCTCDGEGINCILATSLSQIKNAFRANFKFGGIRGIWIQGTPITSIPADLFGGIRSQQIFIEVNNVSSVDMDAFKASNRSLAHLSLFGNRLTSFPFAKLQGYQRLGTLNLGKNFFQTIPDNAFKSSAINRLILSQNRISHIGQNAFVGLTSLSELQLSYNQLTSLGPLSLALTRNQPSLQINLQVNQISSVSKTAFQGADPNTVFFSFNRLQSLHQDSFAELIQKIVNKGGSLEVSGNPLTCRGCDYAWLVLNKNVLQQRLAGFRCPDGTGLTDLTYSKIGCNP